jgi:hypothetical protein
MTRCHAKKKNKGKIIMMFMMSVAPQTRATQVLAS